MITLSEFHDTAFVYSCIIRLYGIYLFLTSLEFVWLRRQFTEDGIFSWKIMQINGTAAFHGSSLSVLFSATGTTVIVIGRLLLSLYLLTTPFASLTILPVSILLITTLLLTLRNSIGNDGTDQMSKIICVTLFITFLTRDPKIAALGLWFIAIQSILAYVIAGTAKLISPVWRNGIAVYRIMNTETFGYEPLASWLLRSPRIAPLLSWNIMLFEIGFLGTAFAPWPWPLLLMIWGLLFHGFNALVMGLNHFFWIFLATYPAIIYLNLTLHH